MASTKPLITVIFTVEEIDSLRTMCVSTQMTLEKDPHVSAEERLHWYTMQDKLMMAKIRQEG